MLRIKSFLSKIPTTVKTLPGVIKDSPIRGYIPYAGPIITLATRSKDIYNSTNPITLVKEITLTLAEECLPPPLVMTVECAVFFVNVGSMVVVPSNPITWNLALTSITQVVSRKK